VVVVVVGAVVVVVGGAVTVNEKDPVLAPSVNV
jgi:hypothetical protein